MADPEFEDIYNALSRPETPNGWTRRRFLQATLAGAGAAMAAPYLNMAEAFAAAPLGRNDGVLVVITMGGGNDSLNMVVPTGNSTYYSKRPTIAVKQADALPLAGGLGLHPKLANLKNRFDAGQVAIVQGVGVPNPDLSHFTSMATWMKGSAGTGPDTSGWLGRYLDGLDHADLRGVAIGSSCPLHMAGERTQATAVPTSSGGMFGGTAPTPVTPACSTPSSCSPTGRAASGPGATRSPPPAATWSTSHPWSRRSTHLRPPVGR